MATISKEILIEAHPDTVWAAVRDAGAVDQRLAQGFVIDARLDGDARVVTFANGSTIRELLLGVIVLPFKARPWFLSLPL